MQNRVGVDDQKERVARAICAACRDNPESVGYDAGSKWRWQDYLGCAEAAMVVATIDLVDVRERLARAICVACMDNPDHVGDAVGHDYRWQDYLGCADATLGALAFKKPSQR